MGPPESKGKKRQAPQPAGEEEFVRGGGSGLAAIEKKRLEQEAYAEAEADLAAAAKKGGGKRHRKGDQPAAAAGGEAGDDEDAFFSSLSAQGRLPKFVELLKFKSLSKGCKLWGAVIEVSPRELVVSLPHGLRGHVAYAEASDWLAEQSKKAEKAAAAAAAAAAAEEEDANGGAAVGRKRKAAGAAGGIALPPLSDLFHIGQLVRCSVTGLRTGADAGEGAGAKQGGKGGKEGKSGAARKRVDLSLRVSKMNAGLGAESLKEGLGLPACVRSVEDHGYLLALGVKGVSGFLPKKDAEAAGRLLAPGMLVEVVVGAGGLRPAGGASSVTVTCKPEAVAAAAAKEWDGLNIGSLLPGQLVTARVRNVLSDGLLASFLTYFSGTVDPFHLGTDLAADWRKQFSPNQRLRARILYVDPAAKRVGLTLQRHLLSFALPPNFPMLGQVFESAVVRRVDQGLGLLCELPTEGPQGGLPLAPGYAHISNLADSKVEDLSQYRPGQRVRARVLGFRPMDGLAVLSTKPSVIDQSVASVADLRPGMPVSGSVVRVEDYGLLVAITPSIRALVPVLHASDLGTAKGLKKFKEGQKVAGKVLSVDTASKKVTLTLKPSVVGSKLPPITCLQDAVPGGRSHGVVTGTADFGVFVQFFGGMAGLVHVSECGLEAGQKPGEAFQPGQVVKCRVLGGDPARKGLKLSLVSKSKKAAAAAGAAEAGAAAGEAAAATAGGEAAAAADTPAADQEQPGKKTDAAGGKAGKKKRGDSEAAAVALGSYQPGDVVRGTVAAVHTKDVDGQAVPDYFELAVAPAAAVGMPPGAASTPAVGRLEVAHLADHPAAASALATALTVGSQLGPLLVLQRVEGAKHLRLTRKAAMLEGAAAGLLPANLADVAEGALLPGYVASVTDDAVFVRFLGGLTGRAGLAQLSDTFVSDPHLFFREGQSVRATVVQVDREKERFSVALKQSLCGGKDAAYLRSLFSDLEEASRLGSEAADVDWAAAFPIGGLVPGEVHASKDYGLICDLAAHEDVVGMAAPHQVPAGASQEPGTTVQAVVLDVNKREGIVELSLQTALVQRAQAASAAAAAEQQQQPKKKQKQKKGAAAAAEAAEQMPQLQEGQQVAARIELVKAAEGYCVASISPAAPAGGSAAEGAATAGPQQQPLVGFFAVADFNLQQQAAAQVARQFEAGSSVEATVAALPSGATGGRLLLSVPLAAKPVRAARPGSKPAGVAGSRAETRQAAPAVGSCVQATVAHVHALHADLTLEGGTHGRLHITEAAPGSSGKSPLAALAVGSQLEVAVLGRVQTSEGRRHGLLECSSKADVVAAAKAGQTLPRHVGWATLKRGQALQGFVQEVGAGLVWCTLSPNIRGRAYATQAASSVKECEQLEERFKPGTPVQATVLHVDGRKHALDVSLLPTSSPAAAAQPPAGTLVLGRLTAVGGGIGGVRVQLSARSTGRVHLADIHDAPVQQALAGLKAGQYCRAAVLGPDPAAPAGGKRKGGDGAQLLLSLRPSAGGQCAAHAVAQQQQQQKGEDTPQVVPGPLKAEQLKPGQRVAGYVKSAGPAGVFVSLARNLDARIRLGQLSDGFVEQPADAFPEGRLVVGQVLSTEGGRVELTLRQRKVGPSLESLEEGQVVRGAVKQVAKYGVFVQLEGSPGVTGLAHVSELADDFVKDPAALFNPGQRVVARVLKVDASASRLSLGLKPSYFEDLSDLEDGDASEQEPDFDAELATAGGDSSDDEELATAGGDSSDDEEIRALLRRARGGGKASGDGDSDAEEEEDSEAGVSGSSDEEEGGSEDEGGMQLAGGEHGQLDSDDEFDLDEAASEGGSDEE